jgi:Flp pilus assembly protein TadG
MRRQRGLTTVEFAIVGAVALLVLILCIEIARALFVWNTITEATRRGARVAVVSPMNDVAIANAVLAFSAYLSDFSAANITVTYRDAAWATTTVSAEVAFVTVAITGYTHQFLVPAFVTLGPTAVLMPPFTTTLPAESLGFDPDDDA